MTEIQDPMIGRLVLGRYRILRQLAQGGMGTVYLARVEGAAGFAKPVVVKRMLPHLSTASDRQAQFIREAQILSNLRHTGIVNVVDFGKQDDAHVMVLEYVHGYNLGQWLKYGIRTASKMPWETAVHVMLQVLAALHYAHSYKRSDGSRAGIIHRDISPGNILIDVDASVRLADFGIARMEVEQTDQEKTGEGVFKGKLPYAAPELFSNEKASTSTDIYACGVVLYQLLAGSNPFTASDVSAIVRRVMSLVPAPISSIREDVPKEFDAILAKVLAKQARRRFPTAADFAAALRAQLRHAETEVAAEVAIAIREDFTGDMPRVLGLQTLDELEEAWRRANTGLDVSPVLSSMPPTVKVDLLVPGARIAESNTLPVLSRSGLTSRRVILAAAGVALLAIGVAAGAVLLARRPVASSEPRFLVVESNAERGAALPRQRAETQLPRETEGPPSASVAAGQPPESPPAAVPTSAGKSTRTDDHPRDSGNSLSRTFAKRQSAILGCFQQNAMNVSGAPELSIRFSIDATGSVTTAAVRPPAVASTALGRCLESVARSTHFGAQEKPLVFSIPITARAK